MNVLPKFEIESPAAAQLPAVGALLAGGFYVGQIKVGADVYALIVSPKEAGSGRHAWNASSDSVRGAESYDDGLTNTVAMAEAGSKLAQWALQLDIGGHADWYIPSRDELELMYRTLKPTQQENYASFRDGDNPSSVPAGYPYTEQAPAQTAVETFRAGGAEAMDPLWHWSSTQYATNPSDAWLQYFLSGPQYGSHKSYEGRARAVRRFKI